MQRFFTALVAFTGIAVVACNTSSDRPDVVVSDVRGDIFVVGPPPPPPPTSDGGLMCPTGLVDCDGRCVSTSSDSTHCGRCNNACVGVASCREGTCRAGCESPLMICNELLDGGMPDAGGMDAGTPMTVARCIDPNNDPRNCGGCGRTCAAVERCAGGTCTSSCPMGQRVCMERCTDTQIDPANCGACGSRCSGGQRCENGMCVSNCPMGQESCDRVCRDVSLDRNHCGRCGNICSPSEVCLMGRCQLTCGPLVMCTTPSVGDAAATSFCADTRNDVRNCGICGRSCRPGEVCRDGMCVVSCQEGQFECLGRCLNLQTDNQNCGVCGRACIPGQSCIRGVCEVGCLNPLITCARPGDAGTFCADPRFDAANCGACGRACAERQQCMGGTCQYVCFAGQTLCGTACTNLQSDPNNCGSCGRVCTRGAVCNEGRCEPRCTAPLVGCPTAAPTMCIDARYDPSNCGTCGRQCASDRLCLGGTCCTAISGVDQRVPLCMGAGGVCNEAFAYPDGQSVAQGFRTTTAGFLVRARVRVTNPYAVRGLAAQVLILRGDSPTAIPLPSVTVGGATIARTDLIAGVTEDYYDAAFSPPPRLEAGTNYFLVIRVPPVTDCDPPCVRAMTGGGCECPPLRWNRHNNSTTMVDVYDRGFSFTCGASCPLWNREADFRDQVFELYISPVCS